MTFDGKESIGQLSVMPTATGVELVFRVLLGPTECAALAKALSSIAPVKVEPETPIRISAEWRKIVPGE